MTVYLAQNNQIAALVVIPRCVNKQCETQGRKKLDLKIGLYSSIFQTTFVEKSSNRRTTTHSSCWLSWFGVKIKI